MKQDGSPFKTKSWPNGCMDQDPTWYGGRPQPKGLCVRWGPSPLPKTGEEPPIFGTCLLRPNVCMDQDGTWHRCGPWSRPHCARWGPSSSPRKGAKPQFSAPFYCGQTAGCIKMPLGRGRPQPRRLCVRWGLSPFPKKGGAPNFRPTTIVAKQMHGSRCHLVQR